MVWWFYVYAMCLLECLGFCMFMNNVQFGLHVENQTLENRCMCVLGLPRWLVELDSTSRT